MDEQKNSEQTPEESISREQELAAQLAEAEKQLEQYKDLLLRKAAEFENFKKRAENESAAVVKFANEELISEIIPVVDDFERSLKLSKDRKDFESFYKGVELIYQKMMKMLAGLGIKTFETVGKEFNVAYHDALMQMPKEDVPHHTILEEIEKGYSLHDKVIRHAKVIVSAAPASGEPAEGLTSGLPPDHQEPRES
jgi:molecular chaperone GrpE